MHVPCAEQICPEPLTPGLHCPSDVHGVAPEGGGVPVVVTLQIPALQLWPVGQSQLV
jgi:hypothetical protein